MIFNVDRKYLSASKAHWKINRYVDLGIANEGCDENNDDNINNGEEEMENAANSDPENAGNRSNVFEDVDHIGNYFFNNNIDVCRSEMDIFGR